MRHSIHDCGHWCNKIYGQEIIYSDVNSLQRRKDFTAYFLPHRAAAAFLAIIFRLRADSDSARALPPLDAPSLLSATAAWFRVSGGSGGRSTCPVNSWTTCQASWFVSLGRFGLLAREGMVRLWHMS
jgi:hypothetical protein